MTLPSSGQISMSQITTEFGGASNLSAQYRDNSHIYSQGPNINIPTSGQISFSQFYGARNEMYLEIGTNGPINLANLYVNNLGSLSYGPVKVRFKVVSGAVVYSTDPNTPAINFGQFPTGSVIYLDNYGEIYGGGGYGGNAGSPGGGGGTAVYAMYYNQTMIITNYGYTKGGGGGGGGGGAGGGGYYDNCYQVWDGASGIPNVTCGNATADQCCQFYNGSSSMCYSGGQYNYCPDCRQQHTQCDRIYTSGGFGGGGGHGTYYGNGAAAGGGGGSPGTNAGWGGSGGSGGDWGSYGNAGSAGGNGNNGSGAAGGAGGAPGYYLRYISGTNISFNNQNTVAGWSG